MPIELVEKATETHWRFSSRKQALGLDVHAVSKAPFPGAGGADGVPGALPSEPRAVRGLPAHLVPCYSDAALHRREARLPLTMANLVDLVQRVERDPDFVTDMRVVLTTLLHRFRVDGLERDPLVAASAGVTPFRLTGLQHTRHRVLTGRLLSGNANLFPNASLSLHQQVSGAGVGAERTSSEAPAVGR